MEGPHLLKDVHVLTPLLPIFLSDFGVIRNKMLLSICGLRENWRGECRTLPAGVHKIIE
jgi:hypothetical protein